MGQRSLLVSRAARSTRRHCDPSLQNSSLQHDASSLACLPINASRKIVKAFVLHARTSGGNHTPTGALNHLNYGIQHLGRSREIRQSLLETVKSFLAVNLDQLVLRQMHD